MSKHGGKRYGQAPKLTRLTHAEAQSVQHMFSLYDYKANGRIPLHLAKKLLMLLGFEEGHLEGVVLTAEVTLGELLIALDSIMPEPEPMLNSSLSTFCGLVGKHQKIGDETIRAIVPKDISDHIEALGRPPAAIREVKLMLESMLEYDDCTNDPVLATELFEKEVLAFQKKNNALKEFR